MGTRTRRRGRRRKSRNRPKRISNRPKYRSKSPESVARLAPRRAQVFAASGVSGHALRAFEGLRARRVGGRSRLRPGPTKTRMRDLQVRKITRAQETTGTCGSRFAADHIAAQSGTPDGSAAPHGPLGSTGSTSDLAPQRMPEGARVAYPIAAALLPMGLRRF
jgi:hypothetical protein